MPYYKARSLGSTRPVRSFAQRFTYVTPVGIGAIENPRALLAAIVVGTGLVLAVGLIGAVSSKKR